jgi:hypothetical protein
MIDGYTLEVTAQSTRFEAEQRAASRRLVCSARQSSEDRALVTRMRTVIGAARLCQPARLIGFVRYGAATVR